MPRVTMPVIADVRPGGTRYFVDNLELAFSAAANPVPTAEGSLVISDAGLQYAELLHPGSAGYALVTNAGTAEWDPAPAWTGLHTFEKGMHVTVPTATDIAAIFQTTDDNLTKHLIEVRDSANVVLASMAAGDSATFFQINQADTTSVFTVDTVDQKVNFGNLGKIWYEDNADGGKFIFNPSGGAANVDVIEVFESDSDNLAMDFTSRLAGGRWQLYRGGAVHVVFGANNPSFQWNVDHVAPNAWAQFYGNNDVNLLVVDAGDDSLGVGVANNATLAKLHLQSTDTTRVGQIIQGAAAQTASLLQLQESDGSVFVDSGDGLANSEFVINQQGEDIDFRVEAAGGITDALVVDGAAGQITLGALATGLVKATAGVLSIATGADTPPSPVAVGDTIIATAGPVWDISTTPGAAGYVRVSTATTEVWDQTPTMTGDWTWTSAASANPVLTIENTNADAAAPTIGFNKNTASPADNDDLGAIDFFGETSTGAQERYAYILAESLDVTNADTGGGLKFVVTMDATERSLLELFGYNGNVDQGTIIFNRDGQDVDWRVEAVGQTNALFVQGSDGFVSVWNVGGGDEIFAVREDQNAITGIELVNADGGTLASANFRVKNEAGAGGDDSLNFGITGTGRTPLGVLDTADTGVVQSGLNVAGGLLLRASGNSQIVLAVNQDDEVLRGTSTAVVINDDSKDQDFRVESDNLTHALFVNAGTDKVGLNTPAPATLLELNGGTGESILTIDGGNSSNRGINFSLQDGTVRNTLYMDANEDLTFNLTSTTDNYRFQGATTDLLVIQGTGNVGIGVAAPAASALLELSSVTGALLLSRMTTGERNILTAVNGMIVYNSSTNAFNFYENGAWVSGSGLA